MSNRTVGAATLHRDHRDYTVERSLLGRAWHPPQRRRPAGSLIPRACDAPQAGSLERVRRHVNRAPHRVPSATAVWRKSAERSAGRGTGPGMRPLTAILAAIAAAVALAAAPAANAATSSKLSMTAKITRFHATASGVVASGTLTGRLSSGTSVSRDSAPVKFAVAAKRHGARCNVITLRLAPLDLELLGVQVTTSHISLDVYARRGRVLGNLFCALARAKVTFPRTARVARALNSHLDGRSLRVFSTSASLPASAAQAQPQSCQVLKLVLGPLHLDLLGLVVDLYGKTRSDPVIV